jgi:hypothetical protein
MMSAASPGSNAPRSSWRQRRKQETAPSRHLRRAVATTVAIGLIAVFVWALVPGYWRELKIACLASADYDVLQAPPLAFAGEDQQQFQNLAGPHTAVRLLQGLREARGIETSLLPELQQLVGRKTDKLIVYVVAHGVSAPSSFSTYVADKFARPAAAYLLTSNYDGPAGQGRYAMTGLLTGLKQCKAGLKLLVLDAGDLNFDPAAGLVVNDFAPVLEKEVQSLADDTLWVLVSHDFLERSHVSPANQRRVFGDFVAAGLAGAADSNDDDQVDLAELFRFVKDNVSRWVWNATGNSQTQTPRLLRGGRGRSQPEPVELTRITNKPSKNPSKGRAASALRKDAVAPMLAQRSGIPLLFGTLGLFDQPAGSVVEAPAAADTAPAPPGDATPAATPQGPAAATPAAAIQTAAPAGTANATANAAASADAPEKAASQGNPPAATAAAKPDAEKPQKPLSQLEELLAREWTRRDELMNHRSGSGWTPSDYAPHLWRRYQAVILGFERRLRAGKALQAEAADLFAREVGELQRRIASAGDEFARGAARKSYEQRPEIADAVQARNDSLSRFPDYLAWLGQNPASARGDFDALTVLLDDCHKVNDVLLEADNFADGSPPSAEAAESWLERLSGRTKRLLEHHDQVERRLQETISSIVANPPRTAAWLPQAEALLNTALPSATQRQALIRILAKATVPGQNTGSLAGPSTEDREVVSRQAWEQLGRLAGLYKQFALFVELDTKSPRDQKIGHGLELSPADSTPDSQAVAAYNRFGAAFASLCRGRMSEIVTDLAENHRRTARRAETLLRLLDPRLALDADRQLQRMVSTRTAKNPLTNLGLPNLGLPPLEMLSVAGSGVAETGAVALAMDAPQRLEWKIKSLRPAKTATYQVDYAPGDLEVKDPRDKPVAPGARGEVSLGAGNAAELVLLARAKREASREANETTLTLNVTVGNERRTVVARVALPSLGELELVVQAPEGTPQPTRLQQGTITLHPFARGQTSFNFLVRSGATSQRKVHYELFALAPPGPELARSAMPFFQGVVDVPAGGAAVPLPLKAAPSAPTPPAAAPRQASPTPAKDESVSIAHGLVCRLRDAVDPSRASQTRIEVAVQHPSRYLLPIARYDLTRKRIVIDLQAKQGALLPADGSQVVWKAPGLQGKFAAQVLAGSPADLYADVEPTRRTLPVHLDVDGYPRAFIFNVPCDIPGIVPQELTNLHDLRIVEPQDGQVIRQDPDKPTKIDVALQADMAPSTGPYEVAVRLQDDPARVVRGDRVVDVRMIGSETGECVLSTRVDDLKFSIEADAYRNQPVELVAELRQDSSVLKRERRTIKLDNGPPYLEIRTRPGASVALGRVLTVEAVATDKVSGVQFVEFAFEVTKAGEMKDPQKVSTATAGGLYRGQLTIEENMPLGEHTVLIKATDWAGFESPTSKLKIRVVKPTTSAGNPPAPNVNDLIVTVTYGGPRSPVARAEVSIEGPKRQTLRTGEDGTATFRNLPAGAYTVKAVGIAKGNFHRGEAKDVVVEAPPAAAAAVPLELQ